MNIAGFCTEPQYHALKDYVLRHTGLSYYSDKDEDFAMRLSRRISARGAPSCAAYLQMLRDPASGPGEMDCLVGELTIGETYFFRQQEHFDLLRAVIIPEMLHRNQSTRQLRIWSAGCATGAEPYSISLLLQLEFREQFAGWDVSILATDINVDFLRKAHEARFGDWALRATPDAIRERCFLRDGKTWILRPEYRSGVTFRYHNLADQAAHEEPSEYFDLILCRNVLIYFSREPAAAVLDRFYRRLSDGGWLLVGYAEPNMEMFQAFETVSTPQATAYRKRSAETRELSPQITWQPPVWPEAPALAVSPISLIAPQIPESVAVNEPLQAAPPPTVDEVRMLADSGHWDSAIALMEELTRLEALNPAAHFTAALIHEHLGSIEKARESLRRAIYLDRSFALAHYHLGSSLKSTRELESAVRSFRNALDILRSVPDDEPIPYGDSITAGELRALATAHLSMSSQ